MDYLAEYIYHTRSIMSQASAHGHSELRQEILRMAHLYGESAWVVQQFSCKHPLLISGSKTLHKIYQGLPNCRFVDKVVLLLTTFTLLAIFTGIHSNCSAARQNLGGNLQNKVRSAMEEATTSKQTSGLVCTNFASCRSACLKHSKWSLLVC